MASSCRKMPLNIISNPSGSITCMLLSVAHPPGSSTHLSVADPPVSSTHPIVAGLTSFSTQLSLADPSGSITYMLLSVVDPPGASTHLSVADLGSLPVSTLGVITFLGPV